MTASQKVSAIQPNLSISGSTPARRSWGSEEHDATSLDSDLLVLHGTPGPPLGFSIMHRWRKRAITLLIAVLDHSPMGYRDLFDGSTSDTLCHQTPMPIMYKGGRLQSA